MTGPSEPVVPTILVADDEPDLVTLVRYRLAKAGFHVLTAVDGGQALTMVKECMPQVVVLDVMMPVLTGIEVLDLLRADPRTAHIPVILISAGFEIDLIDPDVLTSADDYIKKPFSPTALSDSITAILAR